MIRNALIIFLFLFGGTSFAQEGRVLKPSCPEKWWAITHPFIANKARKITHLALAVTNEMKSDTTLDGNSTSGQVDAFRHAFWMACISQKIKAKKAIALGKAHEKGNYQAFKKGRQIEENDLTDSVSCAMDLFNNQIGVILGSGNRNINTDELKEVVKAAILRGEMLIVSQDSLKRFRDCNGNVIDGTFLIRRWITPRCLVSSNKSSNY